MGPSYDGESMGLRVTFDTPITYETATGDTVHCPMIEAVVHGVATRLILDTGSTDHVLTRVLADRAGLQTWPGDAGKDHAGAPVPSWGANDPDLIVGGHRSQLADVKIIDGPPPFAAWGIGGFLSPQKLAAGGYAVVDLVNGHFMHVACDSEADLSTWVIERYPSYANLWTERASGETLEVEGQLVDSRLVSVQLNTGTATSEVMRALLGHSDEPLGIVDSGAGLSGAAVSGSIGPTRQVLIGGTVWGNPSWFVRDSMPDALAILGMDVLSKWVIAVSGDRDRKVVLLHG